MPILGETPILRELPILGDMRRLDPINQPPSVESQLGAIPLQSGAIPEAIAAC